MQRRTLTSLPLFAMTGIAALALTGCGSASPDAKPEASNGKPQSESQPDGKTSTQPNGASPDVTGEVVFSYGDKTYTAQLEFCSLEGGGDALFHGPAFDESGAPVGYLDGDFGSLSDTPYGEARIDFGATGNFQSTDEFVAMGDAMSSIVVTDSSDSSLIVMGGAWLQDGTELPTATLKVTC